MNATGSGTRQFFIFVSFTLYIGFFVIVFFELLRKNLGLYAFALLIALLINHGIRTYIDVFIYRPRPPVIPEAIELAKWIEMTGGGNSFPSGHTLTTWSTYAIGMRGLPKYKHRTLIFIMAVLIPLSRLGLVQHYPSDVLTGIAVGYFIGVLSLRIAEYLQRREGVI